MTSVLEKLKLAKDLQTLAPLLGFRPKSISFLLYKLDPKQRYREFSIPKKSGGTRNISAPNVELLLLQKRLQKLLFLCIADIEKGDPIRANRRIAHGARKHYSIYTNSVRHKGKKFVCNLDLKDFFPSINFGRVRGYFIKNDRFALNPKVATLIAQISCHNNCLPQGSPTSSLIADLIAGSLDQRLNKIAQDNNCSYTRYIDDLTISTNKATISHHIAFLVGDEFKEWQIGEALRSVIERSGFEINEQKFRVQYFSGRQSVTGLVVNQKVNINTDYTRKVRAMVNNYCKNGESYEIVKKLDERVAIELSPMRLRGMLTHIFWVKGREFKYRRFSDKEKEVEPSFMKLYRRFLDFDSFFNNGVPIILCEGKTDHIYLKCALAQIGQGFPLLTKKENGALLVKFFRYGKHSLPVQRLGGGCGDTGLLIGQFSRRTAQFTSEKRKGP